ncbi:MAG: endonuclease/exonuclease/phosphatase family protein [Actinomycetes bacterium]
MRIVTWNCCQAFRTKWNYPDSFGPDVIVVPEAESIRRQPQALLQLYPNHQWIGDNENKGLLVLSSDSYDLSIHESYDPSHRYVLPLQVSGSSEFTMLAVWTQRDKGASYTQHLSRALETYEPLLHGDALVVGDFNANTIWDQEHRRDVTHSENVAWLNDHGLESAYHFLTDENQGQESQFTHAFRRNPNSLFHIDYVFATKSLLGTGSSVTIPPISDWIGRSDHGPLVVELRSDNTQE